MSRHEPLQLELRAKSWGGCRDGAGRKPGPGRRSVPHRVRPAHDPRCPAHVTLRARSVLPSLRSAGVFSAIRTAFAASSSDSFRLLQFSVQSDHLHLLVESDSATRLARGVQGLAIRVARAVNRVLARHGAVWAERYHVRTLRTPREVRNALVYVLQNFRKHLPGARGADRCSSAAWFDGWRRRLAPTALRAPVAAAQTWLARLGWRRHGLIDPNERPRTVRRGR